MKCRMSADVSRRDRRPDAPLPLHLKREVLSGIRPLPCVSRTAPQRFVLPDLQNLHSAVVRGSRALLRRTLALGGVELAHQRRSHSHERTGMTWSPTATSVTPSPIDSTTPPPSCPAMIGKAPSCDYVSQGSSRLVSELARSCGGQRATTSQRRPQSIQRD